MSNIKTYIAVLADIEQKADLTLFYQIFGVDGDKYWDDWKHSQPKGILSFISALDENAKKQFLSHLEQKQNMEYGLVSISLEELVGAKLEPLEDLLDKSVQSYVFEKMELHKLKKTDVSYETRILITIEKTL